MKRAYLIAPAFAAALAGCVEEAPPALPARPVLSTVVQSLTSAQAALVGTVAARHETDLGFTILGRLSQRPVQIGDRIVKGQLVAAIDTAVLESSLRQAAADLESARAQLENAEASRQRQVALLASRASSQASLDNAQQSAVAARANVTQAEANLRKAREQLDKAKIHAEFPGVVTATGAEQGELVLAGQSVVTVARTDVREAVIDVREDTVSALAIGEDFQIALQQNPAMRIAGQVREIAPQADAVTRTRRVRILLTDPPEEFRLGSTVIASPLKDSASRMRIPSTAILQVDDRPYVWLVDPQADGGGFTVTLQEVTLRSLDSSTAEILSGLQPGQRVVTAGVHSLKDGQQVRLYRETQS